MLGLEVQLDWTCDMDTRTILKYLSTVARFVVIVDCENQLKVYTLLYMGGTDKNVIFLDLFRLPRNIGFLSSPWLIKFDAKITD